MGRLPTYTDDFIEDLRLKLEEWTKNPDNWFIYKFAHENNLWNQRMYDFAKRSETFQDTLKRAEQIQSIRLAELALANKVNVTMAIFTLKNLAKWRDKQPDEEPERTTNITLVVPEDKKKIAQTIDI